MRPRLTRYEAERLLESGYSLTLLQVFAMNLAAPFISFAFKQPLLELFPYM